MCMCAARVLERDVPCCLHWRFGDAVFHVSLNDLSCYLSLIFNHSATKRDKKTQNKIVNQNGGGRVGTGV